MAKITKLTISAVVRNQRRRGNTSSQQMNALQAELVRDLSAVRTQWNELLVPLVSTLPDGTLDSQVNAFTNGLDGRTLFANSAATNTTSIARYYNASNGRPNTVYEQFVAAYDYVDLAVEDLEETINDTVAGAGGLTSAQKERIGLNVFDSTLASSSTSIDGKSTTNQTRITQLATDIYGSATFSAGGAGILNNSVKDMVDALLELHSGDWDTDLSLSHSIDAADITGTFQQNLIGPSSAAPGGINDSYSGTPADTVDDLNLLRTQLKNTKGTGSWTTAITPDGTWSAVTTQPDSIQDIIVQGGSGSRTDSNPWAYDYTDIDGLSTRLSNMCSYTGSPDPTDTTPLYTAVLGFSQGDDLTAAIGALVGEILTVSGEVTLTSGLLNTHIGNTSNPHSVTLAQVATAGGNAPAAQITISDTEGQYDASTVEAALQEVMSGLNTLSGEHTSVTDALDTRLDAVELFETETTFRRSQVNISSLGDTSSVSIVHNAGMYPQVQILNLNPGTNHVEPVSTTSGIWIEHTSVNEISITNNTGATLVSGLALLNW